MTKTEALKAAIDGERVYILGKNDSVYVYWDGHRFLSHDDFDERYTFFDLADYNGEWRIVPKTVDFATAWKAYEEGKTIQDDEGFTYNEDDDPEFTSAAIRGPWLIL